MNRKRNTKALSALLVCLFAALTCVIVFRISAGGDDPVPAQQVTSKLDSPAVSMPEAVVIEAQPEVEQVNPAWDKPARAARYVNIDMTDEELEELAEILFLEAGNQSAEGQQAVVEVVFNRVLHSGFPDTVHDVLHQGEGTDVPQFSTISLLGTVTPTQAQYDAINEALYP